MFRSSNFAFPAVVFALFLPVFVAFALVAGLILHFTVEKPFLLLKNRVRLRAPRRERPAAGVAVTDRY